MVQTTVRDLHGRRALVSGGTKGAGAAIARRVEAAGATVLVTSPTMSLPTASESTPYRPVSCTRPPPTS
jgi:NAD(P)-dependent dehydrogenase (short-subunit alcohol dehydrogenase family)